MAKKCAYLFVFKDQNGGEIAEYATNAAPPRIGDVMNLKNIADTNYVEVLSLKYLPTKDQMVVKLKVRTIPFSKAIGEEES